MTTAHPSVALPGGERISKLGQGTWEMGERAARRRAGREGQQVIAVPGTACDQMILYQPVPFYVAERTIEPSHLKAGQELWMEVTVPPAGPPRPLQLALKDNGAWKPLASQ